ncbi:cytoplasmic protein [Thermodesulfobacteriota bacterium]
MKRDPLGFIVPEDNSRSSQQRADFDQLEAMELFCPECRQAVPVRKSLLLILPEGDKYEYCCQYCSAKVGDKIDHSGQFHGILKT